MNQSLSFNATTSTVITRYIVGFTPANAGETAILDILLTADASGFLYGDLSEHGGDIATIDSTAILNIVAGSSTSITVARRAAALLIKINNSPSLSDIISFGFINSTHIRRSIPVSNISLRNIADEFTSPNVNSKIRLYGGGESGVSATATGVQRSFSEFANKEFKIIKYLSNTINETNLTTLFSANLTQVNSKKAIANSNVFITGVSATASWAGNIDLVNYGVIMGRSAFRSRGGNVINIGGAVTNGIFQVVNLGEMIPAGGSGGDGGAGANGYVYTSIGGITTMGVGGIGGGAAGDLGSEGFGMSSLSGVGVIQLATFRKGLASNLAYWGGDGGNSGYGGGAGQAGTDGNLGNIGHTRNPNGSVVETSPPSTGLRAPKVGYAGGLLIYGNNRVNFTDNGYSTGDTSGVVTVAGGIGEILSVTPPSTYIIPKDSIILYDGVDPNYSEWRFYGSATDNFIKGTATQGDIGTIVPASGTTSIDASGLTVGFAGAHINNNLVMPRSGTTYNDWKYDEIGGDHTHQLYVQSASGNPIPAKSGITLLRAMSDQRRFPPKTKFINESSRSPTSVVDILGNPNQYIFGSLGTSGNYKSPKVATTRTFNTGLGGTHDHRVSNIYGYDNIDYQNQTVTGYTTSPAPDLRSHTHANGVISLYLDSLQGKLLSLWADATSTILCTNDILMYCGELSLLPSYWKVCDGTNGTIDMRNYFFGHAISGNVHGEETSLSYSTTVPSITNFTWTHSHAVTFTTQYLKQLQASHSSYNASHTHTISGNVISTSDYLPAHIKLAFIKFVP